MSRLNRAQRDKFLQEAIAEAAERAANHGGRRLNREKSSLSSSLPSLLRHKCVHWSRSSRRKVF